MSSNKRSFLKNIFTINQGGGCGKHNLPHIFQPKPITKIPSNINTTIHQKPTHYDPSSSSTSFDISQDNHEEEEEDYTTPTTATTFSLYNTDTNSPLSLSKIRRQKIGDTVAVVKDSNDPYGDFRRSMIEMILEREIYSKDGLEELLKYFLELNSPSHHGIIIKAFMDIWNGEGGNKLGPT